MTDDGDTGCTASCDDWPCHYIHPRSATGLPPSDTPADIACSLGPWMIADGAKWTLAPDAKLTTEDGRVIGTVTELFYEDNQVMVEATVSDAKMVRMLRSHRAEDFSLDVPE